MGGSSSVWKRSLRGYAQICSWYSLSVPNKCVFPGCGDFHVMHRLAQATERKAAPSLGAGGKPGKAGMWAGAQAWTFSPWTPSCPGPGSLAAFQLAQVLY